MTTDSTQVAIFTFTLAMTVVYGSATFIVTVFGFSAHTMSWLAQIWDSVGQFYIASQLLPFLFRWTKDDWLLTDTYSSATLAGIVIVLIPVINLIAYGTIAPNFWVREIWLSAIGFSILDVMIAFIQWKTSRLLP